MPLPLEKVFPWPGRKGTPASPAAWGARLAALYDWVEAAILSLICVVLAFTFVIRIVGVEGPSMQTTLYSDERLLLRTLFYTPQRGDIVVIDRYAEEPLIKRVIAVAGDTLEIDAATGAVYRNGQPLDEPYIHDKTEPIAFWGEQTVPKGHVFVMGDNRMNSHDSRSADIGFVNVKDIRGKAVFRIWPLTRLGFLN